LLFRGLTGRNPFAGSETVAALLKVVLEEPPALAELIHEPSPPLQSALNRMLDKDKSKRPRDGFAVARLMEWVRNVEAGLAEGDSPPSIVTTARRQFVCLVVGRFSRPADSFEATRSGAAQRWPEVQRVLAQMDAQLRILIDGSFLVTFEEPEGTARGIAVHAARCAAGMRSVMPQIRLAIASGVATTGGRALMGETIERAAKMLRPREGEPLQGILVDDTTAKLIGPIFVLEPLAVGAQLIGERRH
jgi:hypothetical protein